MCDMEMMGLYIGSSSYMVSLKNWEFWKGLDLHALYWSHGVDYVCEVA